MSTLQLTATLTSDARYYTGTDGSAYLLLQLGQDQLPGAAEVRWQRGSGYAAQYCAGNASRLYRKGVRINYALRRGLVVKHPEHAHLVRIAVVAATKKAQK